MIAIAGSYVRTRAVAEEVVQEAWLGVVDGLDRFEGRSSLRTWILKILVNTAMGRGTGRRAACPSLRLLPRMSTARRRARAVPAAREAFAGNWTAFPSDWSLLPEDKLLGRETLDVVKTTITRLPEAQGTVITMRDVAGCSAEEVCDLLEISAANQRVLLHRARSKVRAALERHLDA